MRRTYWTVVWMTVLLLVPMSLLAQGLAAIPPLRSPVVDVTGTLDAMQIKQLQQQALALQQRKGAQLQILIVPTTQPETIEQYAQRVFDQWKIGRKGVDDGVLLLIAKDDHRVRIQPGYGLEGVIPDITANRIIQEYLVLRLREGDDAGGISAATATLAGLIEGEPLPPPVSGHADGGNGAGGSGWTTVLFIGLVVAMLARGILGALPRPLRALLSGVAAGGTALLFTSLLFASAGAAVIGFLVGLASGSPGRFVGGGGWGAGGLGGVGGGWGSGGGGDWGGGVGHQEAVVPRGAGNAVAQAHVCPVGAASFSCRQHGCYRRSGGCQRASAYGPDHGGDRDRPDAGCIVAWAQCPSARLAGLCAIADLGHCGQ